MKAKRLKASLEFPKGNRKRLRLVKAFMTSLRNFQDKSPR